jgi:hypothetical protein
MNRHRQRIERLERAPARQRRLIVVSSPADLAGREIAAHSLVIVTGVPRHA